MAKRAEVIRASAHLSDHGQPQIRYEWGGQWGAMQKRPGRTASSTASHEPRPWEKATLKRNAAKVAPAGKKQAAAKRAR